MVFSSFDFLSSSFLQETKENEKAAASSRGDINFITVGF
jgi:hypothetical protein